MAKEQPKFEQLLAELEQLVERLEGGELSLDDALACYEQGIAKYKLCRQMLQDAEQKVQKLVQGESGQLVQQPFDSETPEEDS